MMFKSSSSAKLVLPFNPWVYFSIFLISNFLLSYFSLPLQSKLWIGLLGLLLPAVLAFKTYSPAPPGRPPLNGIEFLPDIPLWLWVSMAALALFIRFFKLTELSHWPLYDEGFIGFFALDLAHKWDWRLFYGSSQAPPLFIWMLSLFFKLGGASLFSLWFLPAALSALSIPFGYWAARQFFSKSFSFLCAIFLGLGFWPFFIGRFAQMPMLVLPAECVAFYYLGRFLNATRLTDQKKNLAALGLALGIGFYIHVSWFPVAGIIFLTVLWFLRGRWKLLLFFIFPLGGCLLPLFFQAFQMGYGLYLKDLWAVGGSNEWVPQLAVAWAYPRELFWGINSSEFSPELVGGGLLNPIWASLFFLGLLEILKNFNRPLYRWLLAGCSLFLLQGILTKTLETFRILPLLPLLISISIIGFTRLSLTLPSSKAWLLLSALMIPSAGLDFYHLFGPYQRVWGSPANWKNSLKSIERYRADQILKAVSAKWGPGFIFSDFVPGYSDQTLDLACASFQALPDSPFPSPQASWAAVLVNINDQPFLSQRFPNGRTYWLSSDLSSPDGGIMLWVTPLESSQREIFLKWREASLALKPFIFQSLSYVHGGPWEQVLAALETAEPAFQSDPFLRSCYWEKMADTYLRLGGDVRSAILSLQTAVRQGIPSAHLYYRMGTLYLISNEPTKAQAAFAQAVRAPLNRTNAADFVTPPGRRQ